jgi:hypothetical protein
VGREKGAETDGKAKSGDVIVGGDVEFEGDVEEGGTLAMEDAENAAEGWIVEFAGVAYAAAGLCVLVLVLTFATDSFVLRFLAAGALSSVSVDECGVSGRVTSTSTWGFARSVTQKA